MSIAFLNIPVGGIGARAHDLFFKRHEADREAFPVVSVHIDTDPGTQACVDVPINIGIDGPAIEAIKANSRLFGPQVPRIVEQLLPLLRAADARNGARTKQLAAAEAKLDDLFRRPPQARPRKRRFSQAMGNYRHPDGRPFHT